MKRLLSFLLALALCVGMLPAGAWAETAEPTEESVPAETTQETTLPTEAEAPAEETAAPTSATEAQVPVYYSMEAFNAAVVAAIHDHQEDFTLELHSDEQIDFENLVIDPNKHCKDPLLGDYELYSYDFRTCYISNSLHEETSPDATA